MSASGDSVVQAADAEAAEAPFPFLATSRLKLREIVLTDARTLLAIHGDCEAMRWFGTDSMASLEQAEEMVRTFAEWRKPPATGIRWAIVRALDDQLVGTCGLFRWNKRWKSCTVGYELAQEAWGKGLMNEALKAAVTWGFEGMGLNRIEAQVHPHNVSSLRLLARLGFAEEGLLRQASIWDGEHHDLVQLSLLRAEHPAMAR